MKPEGQEKEENVPEKDTRQILMHAADGLLYPSESDYPFEYVEWDGAMGDKEQLSEGDILQLVNKPAGTLVKLISLNDFFANVTQIQDWYEEEEKANVKRFIQLKETLQEHLSDIQVFKVGQIEIDTYIIGKILNSKWAGLSTVLIET